MQPLLPLNTSVFKSDGEANPLDSIPFPSGTIPMSPLIELDFDPYDEEIPESNKNKSPKSKTANFPLDSNGFLALPTPGPYDIEMICSQIKEKLALPQSSWVERLPNGVILRLVTKNSRSKYKGPAYIPFNTAIDFLVGLIVQRADISFSASARILNGNTKLSSNVSSHLNVYAYALDILCGLQQLKISSSLLLLRHSPNAQQNLFSVLLHAMTDSMNYLQAQQEELQNDAASCSDDDELMDGADDDTKNALDSLLYATNALDCIIKEELFTYNRHGGKYAEIGKKMGKKIRFPFDWFPILLQPTTSDNYPKVMIQMIGILKGIPLVTGGSVAGRLWKCFCSLTSFLFHLSASDEYVSLLMSSPGADTLFSGLATILEKLSSNDKEMAYSVRYHILKIFTVLCEREDPFFLDNLHKMPSSKFFVDTIICESSKIVARVKESVAGADTSSEAFLTAREALRVIDLLSHDSNFGSIIIEKGTDFLLEFLTVDPKIFVKYFQAKNSFQEYVALMVYRLIANLHHFDAKVSPPEYEGKFVNAIIQQLSSVFVQNEDGEVEQQKKLTAPFVMANFFYLFQWVSYRYAFTVPEHVAWQEFLAMIESKLEIKYPVIKVPGMRLPKPKNDPSKPPTVEPTVEPQVKSKILRGFSASFGTVTEPDALRDLIKANGGTVLEYVSKSVTHVVCADDSASMQTSSAKLQAAVTKQVPAVSEKFVYDSIEKGELLHERNYLISSHPYKRRRLN